jgi:hypothetical protein
MLQNLSIVRTVDLQAVGLLLMGVINLSRVPLMILIFGHLFDHE